MKVQDRSVRNTRDNSRGLSATMGLLQRCLKDSFCGLAVPEADGRLKIIEGTGGVGSGGIRLKSPTGDLLEGWLDVRSQRLSSAWTLWCGFRPNYIAIRTVETTPWCLVVATEHRPETGETIPVLKMAEETLRPLYHAGLLAETERDDAQRLTELLRHLESPVLFFEDGVLDVFMNPAAEQLLGVSQGIGKPVDISNAMTSLLKDATPLSSRMTQSESHGAVSEGQRYQLHHHERIWDVKSHRLEAAELSGRLWIFSDITEVTLQERALLEGQRRETIGQLAGGVAHQFNNLLTVILGNAEVLEGAPRLAEQQYRQVLDIIAAAERGAEIVAQLLAFAQPRRASESRYDIGLEVNRLLPLIDSLLSEDITCVTAGLDAGVTVSGDPAQLADAIINLVLNARDAMPLGGTLTLSITMPAANRVVVRVCDSGVGMSEELRQRACDPFYTTKGMASARGLGLSVVQGFVHQSGGELQIVSQISHGCCIALHLPCELNYIEDF